MLYPLDKGVIYVNITAKNIATVLSDFRFSVDRRYNDLDWYFACAGCNTYSMQIFCWRFMIIDSNIWARNAILHNGEF